MRWMTCRGISGRPYEEGGVGIARSDAAAILEVTLVGRCRLTVSKPELKARLVSAISA